MFRWTFAIVALAFVSALGTGAARAQGTEVTLKGNILCAHCSLDEGTKCQTAIQVKENDKTITYYFADKGVGESYHKAVCGGGSKAGTVTGVVAEKDGKKWITPKKVEYTGAKTSRLNWTEPYGAGEHYTVSSSPTATVQVAKTATGGGSCPNCRK